MSGKRALIDALLALHKPWYETSDGRRYDHIVSVNDPDDLPKDHVCRTEGDESCHPEWDEHYTLACAECRGTTDEGEPGYSLWPCQTARLATDAKGSS